jgi:hypothetical protein
MGDNHWIAHTPWDHAYAFNADIEVNKATRKSQLLANQAIAA